MSSVNNLSGDFGRINIDAQSEQSSYTPGSTYSPSTDPQVMARAGLPRMPAQRTARSSNSPPPSQVGVQVDANNAGNALSTEAGTVMPEVVCKGVEDFEFFEELGTGSYSTVVAAQDKQTLRRYAIKILDKAHIIKENKVKYVEIEKKSLNRLGEHPGIIHLYFTFQDRASLFFVLDYAPNGELLQLIKRMGSLDEACARYYTAQLIDAVEFMHQHGVVHRDLKPENILLDYKMRIKITDFGTAKLLDKDENGGWPAEVRAASFVGTAEYVSPELLTQKYQGRPADIWAIGCILFQIIAGVPPFQASTQYLTFQRIVKYQYQIPPGFPFLVRDLLKNVFVAPRRRYGIPELKQHAFYANVDWTRKALWTNGPPRLAKYRPTPASLAPPSQLSVQSPALPSSSPSTPTMSPRASVGGIQTPGSAGPQVTVGSTTRRGSAAAAAAALSKAPQQRVPSHAHSLPQMPPQSPARSQSQPQIQAQALAQAQAQQKRHSTSVPGAQHSLHYRSSQERANAMQRSIREQRQVAAAQPPAIATPPWSEAASKYRQKQQPQRAVSSPAVPASNNGLGHGLGSGSGSVHATPLGLAPSPMPADSKLLELPPLGNVEQEMVSLLVDHKERILKHGKAFVNIGSIGDTEMDDEQRKGIFARMFQTRRKARTVLVTSMGRLVVADDDQHIKLDLPLGVPQVLVRQVLRKSGAMSLAVETYNRVISIDNDMDMSDWWAAIQLAKKYVQQANAETERNAHSAAAAAAIAVQRTR